MLGGDLGEVGDTERCVFRDVTCVDAFHEIFQPGVVGNAADQCAACLGDHAKSGVGEALAGEGRHAFDEWLEALEGLHVRIQVQPAELLKQLVAPDV